MKKILKRIAIFGIILVLFASWQNALSFPDRLTLFSGEEHKIATLSTVALAATEKDHEISVEKERGLFGNRWTLTPSDQGEYTYCLKFLGTIPCKTVHIAVAANQTVAACGQTVGVKLYGAGIRAVGFADVGTACPALDAGLAVGDVLTHVNGVEIKNTAHFSQMVGALCGQPFTVTYLRENTPSETMITPGCAEDGSYKIGVWVRDSAAGIGTLTFYHPESGAFAALGHPISDPDTGQSIAVSRGSITDCTIRSVQKGAYGAPGELQGTFSENAPDIGKINRNFSYGIVGTLYDNACLPGRDVRIGSKTQVHTGEASILATVAGNQVEEYSIRIQRVLPENEGSGKSMVIEVTDDRLIEATGGIVQGMSGSPILQDGRLIGAVTHVFVNDPTRGYGVFLEQMLEGLGQ